MLSGAVPTRVISAEGPALWLPDGTIVKSPTIDGRPIRDVSLRDRLTRPRGIADRVWRNGIVILGRPGRAHAIWHFWDGSRFRGWYVNLEEPWRPFRHGFDTSDHVLDLTVDPDGSWSWKDEDELEEAVELGAFSAEEAASFRAEGERVIAEWPFPTGWEEWRPDPEWPLPTVPYDWDA